MGKINEQESTPVKRHHPGSENLIPLLSRTPEEQFAIRSKGGSNATLKGSIGKRLAHLKKKGLTDENAERLVEMITDYNFSSLDTLLLLESIKSKVKTNGELLNLAKIYLDWHKTQHGDRNKINTNIELNMHNNTSYEFIIKYEPIDKNEESKKLVYDAEEIKQIEVSEVIDENKSSGQ